MGLVRFLCSLWEIEDNLPQGRYAAVVGMAMPQMKSGDPGRLMVTVVRGVVGLLDTNQTQIALFSNRWPVDETGRSVAELERLVAMRLGAKSSQIVIPKRPRNPRIRNTYEESRFALRFLRFSRRKGESLELCIVANHLHMRRVLSTFRKVAGGSIVLRWKSVGVDADYGPGYSQERFRHPLLFLFYEIAAVAVSKIKGWV